MSYLGLQRTSSLFKSCICLHTKKMMPTMKNMNLCVEAEVQIYFYLGQRSSIIAPLQQDMFWQRCFAYSRSLPFSPLQMGAIFSIIQTQNAQTERECEIIHILSLAYMGLDLFFPLLLCLGQFFCVMLRLLTQTVFAPFIA